MSTGESVGGDARDDHAGDNRDRRSDRINVGAGDDSVTRIQLAARWAEAYSPHGDSLAGVLKRFRAAYDYLDSVTHGVEPPELDREVTDSHPTPQPVPSAPTAEPFAAPTTTPAYQTPAPQPEPRPWG